MEWLYPFLFGTIFLIGFIFLGMPVGFSLFITGFAGILFWSGLDPASGLLSTAISQTPADFMLLVVPLFVLMAQILSKYKTTDLLYESFWNLFAGIRGSLTIATIGMGTLLGACIGASLANVATMAHLGLQQMLSRGYRRWLAAGSIIGAGGLAIIIPPSIPAIMYAFITDLPILDIFAACVIPGFMLSFGYILLTFICTTIDPDVAPASESVPFRLRAKAFTNMLPFLGLVAIVLGSIFTGICAITESAAIGCLGAFLIAMLVGSKQNRMRNLFTAGRETAITTCYLMLIIMGAKYFGQFWTYTGVIDSLSRAISALPLNALTTLIIMNALVLFLGCIMDSAAIILVVLPILVNGLVLKGFNPLHLGVVFLVNLEMGLITPPVGMNIFVLAGVAQEKRINIGYNEIVRGGVPFLLVEAVVLSLIIAFPSLSLWFPKIIH